MNNDNLLRWTDDADQTEAHRPFSDPPWKLLVVDDDPEVHSVTRFVLNDLRIFDRPLHLVHAHNAQEARVQLRQHPDVAVALLDVVMETAQSGLELVGYIRNELKLAECRIILRTGQPGYAPELTVINSYDINDYRTKAELTHTRLITMVSTALRAYEQLRIIAENRRGLELIINAASELMERHAITSFAEGLLTQLAALLKSCRWMVWSAPSAVRRSAWTATVVTWWAPPASTRPTSRSRWRGCQTHGSCPPFWMAFQNTSMYLLLITPCCI